MADTLNRITLIGNLVKDPEIHYTRDNREVAKLVLATDETWINKRTGDLQAQTEYHHVSVFVPHLIKVAKDFTKRGTKIYIEGKLATKKTIDEFGKEKSNLTISLQGGDAKLLLMDKSGSPFADNILYNQ